MMKQRLVFASGWSACLALTAAASAGMSYDPALDQTFSINDGEAFTVSGTPTTFTADITDLDEATAVGFSFEGTVFVNPAGGFGTPWWTQLQITTPDGDEYLVGGNAGFDTPWDWQEMADSNPETYQHGIGGDAWAGNGLPDFDMPDSTANGMWQFTFVQTFGAAQPEWSDVTITIHSIPAPGGLAMLAVGCLAGGRRRRRG